MFFKKLFGIKDKEDNKTRIDKQDFYLQERNPYPLPPSYKQFTFQDFAEFYSHYINTTNQIDLDLLIKDFNNKLKIYLL